MKEYRCIKISEAVEDTQDRLNEYAKNGWKVICSYAYHNHYLILERDKLKPCKVCGK